MRRLDWWMGLITALLIANLVVSVGIYRRLVPGETAKPPRVWAVPESAGTPRVLHRVEPEYPPQALKNRWEGQVVLRITVDTLGAVARVELVRSSGYSSLDSAAVAAAQQWRFEPLKRDGRPVECSFYLPFRFKIQSP